MSEILERSVFMDCLLDQTEAPWQVEVEMVLRHDAALRLALEAATRERDEANSMFRDYALATQTIGTESALAGIDDPDGTLVGIYRNTLKKLTTAERERDEARAALEKSRRTVCFLLEENVALLSRPAARVTFICTRCGRNGDYHSEPGGDRCEYCGGNGPVCPAPAPSADAATKAVEAAREWLRHGRQWCQTCLEAADLLTRLVSTPAPAPSAKERTHCCRCNDTRVVPSRCSDPQCGDSTWDHLCDLGGEDPCPACAPSAKEGNNA